MGGLGAQAAESSVSSLFHPRRATESDGGPTEGERGGKPRGKREAETEVKRERARVYLHRQSQPRLSLRGGLPLRAVTGLFRII